VFLVKYNILLLSAGETKLLSNIISHAVIKFYKYFACCFNYRQLFWALLSDPHRFSASVPRHPKTSTSPIGLYSTGLRNQWMGFHEQPSRLCGVLRQRNG